MATTDQLTERITLTTMAPMARLAARCAVPLARAKVLTELAYYQETRRLGMKMKEIQDVMSVGFSKVGTLSRDHKDYHAGLADPQDLQRRILLLLWSVPLTEKHILAAFDKDRADEIAEVLAAMVADGRLVEITGRTTKYTVAENHNQLVSDRLLARMAALRSLMTNVAHAIEARFFSEPPGRAFVRTLSFRVRDEDVEKLETFYRDALIPLIRELDEAVKPDEPSFPVKVSFLWAEDTDQHP